MIEHHKQVNNLYDRYQFAYNIDHITETALIKVHTNISDSIDGMTALVLLDLSAQFDIKDHNKYIDTKFRICTVVIAGCKLPDFQQNFDVPQGSLICPKMYCMYTNPFGDIIKQHAFKYHCYVDDIQAYVKLKHGDNMDG